MNDMTNFPGSVPDGDLEDIDFSREEALFRAALDRHAHDIDEPVVIEAPRRATGQSARWLAAVAAVSVASVGGWWALRPDPALTPAPPAVTVASPTPAPSFTPTTTPSSTPSVTPSTTPSLSSTPSVSASASASASSSASGTATGTASAAASSAAPRSATAEVVAGTARQALPAAQSGHLWWSRGQIAVQTPTGWLGGDILCVPAAQADGPMGDGPFVSTQRPGQAECAASAKRTKPVLVVSLVNFGEGSSGEYEVPANVIAARMNAGYVTVSRSDLSPMTEDERLQARAIVRTASTWTTNQDGCPANSPMGIMEQPRPKAWNLATEKVSALSICQYDGMGQFLASARMTAAESGRLDAFLTDLRAARPGVTKGRANCSDSRGTRTLLRATTPGGTKDAYLYGDDCSSYVDDGTTRRALGSWCSGLYAIVPFALPVDQGPGAVCFPK